MRRRLLAAVPARLVLLPLAAALAIALAPLAGAAPLRAADGTPGGVLSAFVQAAARNDARAMWMLLSKPTQRRLGPDLAAFAKGAAVELAGGLGDFQRTGSFKVRMSKVLGATWALAVITGSRTVRGQAQAGAFGAALRGEGGAWRLELDGPVQITVNEPKPGEVIAAPEPQLAVQATAKQQIVGGILYADGVALEGGAGGTGPNNLTIYGPATRIVRGGVHFGAAIAATARDASAVAWTFGFVPAHNLGQKPAKRSRPATTTAKAGR